MFSHIVNHLPLLAAFAAYAVAHTEVEEVTIGGKTYPGFYQPSISHFDQGDPSQSPAWYTNQGQSHQPVFGSQLNHPNIIAHIDAKPSPFIAEAQAGSSVTFKWFHKWQGRCKAQGGQEEGWDCSHHGFSATYLAPFTGPVANIKKEELKFFKVAHLGLIDYPAGSRFATSDADGARGASGRWATDTIFYNDKDDQSQTIQLPRNIPSGTYVMITHISSLHNSNNGRIDDIQFWPQAFTINITGGDDSAAMPEGVVGTKLYSRDDELLHWNLYWHEPSQLASSIPGPPVFSAYGSAPAPKASAGRTDAATTASPAPAAETPTEHVVQPAAEPTEEAPSEPQPTVAVSKSTVTEPATDDAEPVDVKPVPEEESVQPEPSQPATPAPTSAPVAKAPTSKSCKRHAAKRHVRDFSRR